MSWPITIEDVRRAVERLRPHLARTALRDYAPLDAAVGCGIRVLVKHENHQPTNAFKVRNTMNAVAALDEATRKRGLIAATRGNHGAGLAWAARRFNAPVVVVVPHGNNPEKNAAIRGFGAELIEAGHDYDQSVVTAGEIQRARELHMVHSTNDRDVLAGAATLALEIVEDAPEVEAMVIAVGGGSQAVGALTIARALNPTIRVYAVQAAGAAAMHDAVTTGHPRTYDRADTFADGIATRAPYELTYPALREGLAGFVTVTDAEIAAAMRMLVSTTHQLVEGAGAAGLAGLIKLREKLAGKRVAIVLSGGNVDLPTLRSVLAGQL
ncbi:MAG: Serine/threonine dehydratase [Myxococcales bacterium]|nr:Serine/threonine dehydratase [Myxococcales bacterium]